MFQIDIHVSLSWTIRTDSGNCVSTDERTDVDLAPLNGAGCQCGMSMQKFLGHKDHGHTQDDKRYLLHRGLGTDAFMQTGNQVSNRDINKT